MVRGREQRRDARVPLVLRVEYPGMSRAFRDVTENVSAGGLFIRTERDLRVGDRVPLQLSFPTLLDPVRVEVEVVRRRPARGGTPHGVAVRIPADREEDRRTLARLAELFAAGSGPAARKYRVLVVEDDQDVVAMYGDALRALGTADGGIVVEYAPPGPEAYERLASPPPVHLVVANLDASGVALLERMRADPVLARVPVVAVGAEGGARIRAGAEGPDVVLERPVRFGDVLLTIRTLLEMRR